MVSWVLKELLVLSSRKNYLSQGCGRHFFEPSIGIFHCLYCYTCSAQERLDESLKILKAQVDLKLSEDVSVSEEGK